MTYATIILSDDADPHFAYPVRIDPVSIDMDAATAQEDMLDWAIESCLENENRYGRHRYDLTPIYGMQGDDEQTLLYWNQRLIGDKIGLPLDDTSNWIYDHMPRVGAQRMVDTPKGANLLSVWLMEEGGLRLETRSRNNFRKDVTDLRTIKSKASGPGKFVGLFRTTSSVTINGNFPELTRNFAKLRRRKTVGA